MTPEPDKALTRVEPPRTARKAAWIFGAIAVCAGAGAADLPLWIGVLAAIAAATWAQQALLEEVHDGVHSLLLADPGANDRLVGLYASLIGVSFAEHRAGHFDHHRYFGEPEDPDYFIYRRCPSGVREWLHFFVHYFLGVHAVRQSLRGVVDREAVATDTRSLQHPWGTALAQLSLWAVFAWIASPVWYLVAWLLPLLTVTYGIVKLRTLLEHWDGNRDEPPGTRRGALWNLTGPVMANLLGAQFGYNYHANHHARARIPNVRLGELSLERGPGGEPIRRATYAARLREALRG